MPLASRSRMDAVSPVRASQHRQAPEVTARTLSLPHPAPPDPESTVLVQGLATHLRPQVVLHQAQPRRPPLELSADTPSPPHRWPLLPP